MADTIGQELKDARETLCSAINACIACFEKDTGVTVASMQVSLKETKSDGGGLTASTTTREVQIVLNL